MSSVPSVASPPISQAQASSSSSSSVTSSSASASGPHVWLLKLPTFVADQFKRGLQQQLTATASSSSSGKAQVTALATLHVSYSSDGQQQLLLRYSPSDPTQPKEFVVQPRNKRNMLVFTEKQPAVQPQQAASSPSPTSSSNAPSSSFSSLSAVSAPPTVPAPCKFLAPVSLIADVVPADTPSYRALVSRRTAHRLSHSNTQRMEDSDGLVITPQVQAERERKRRRDEERKEEKRDAKEGRDSRRPERERGREGKRVRGSREEVEVLLLRLFSASRWLSMKELAAGTQQPIGFLKDVVADMCVRETKGDNKDKYQLKDKYRIDE